MEFVDVDNIPKVDLLIKKSQDLSIVDKNEENDPADDDDSDDDNDDNEIDDGKLDNGEAKKTKKKKKKKPKKKKSAFVGSQLPKSRMLTGFTDYYVKYGQTNPPTKTVASLFPNNDFPTGEIQNHGETKFPNNISKRITDEEKR